MLARLPIPLPLVLLVAAALLAGVTGPLDVHTAEPTAVVALIVLLFNGGLDIGWERVRGAIGPVLSVGILGTFLTAGILTLAAHFLVGLDWTLASLVGAALAPTDPAVVFSVLGGEHLKGRSGTILEGEAGFNDPAGIALMLGMIELATHADATFLVVVQDFVVQMGLGAAFGFAAALGLRYVHRPALLLLLAGGLYVVTALAGGSGFLAVFVAGLRISDDLESLHSVLASVSEAIVFVALGLTVSIVDIPGGTWADGALLVLVLALVARPLTVLTTLAPADIDIRERAFVAWSGLKGAVPILLAAFAVLEPVPGAARVYDLVFVVVVLSVLAQGTFVPALASRLDLLADRGEPL